MKLDSFDRRLLKALQQDASLGNAELGRIAGLSASQISRRRERLEKAGVIRRYRAEIDPAMLGGSVVVFVRVTLASHSAANARKLRDLVNTTPEILEAHAMTGDTDYLFRVAVPGLAELAAFVNERLLAHPAIARVNSEIVLETMKDERVWPV